MCLREIQTKLHGRVLELVYITVLKTVAVKDWGFDSPRDHHIVSLLS